MYKVLTGAQMFSVRTLTQTEQGLDGALQAIAGMGYTTVQLSGQSREIDPARIRGMLDRHNLKCPATHISFQEMEEDLPAVVARHKLWDCPYVGVGAMPFELGGTAEGLRTFAKRASVVAKKLKDEGLTFIYHNHAFEFRKFDGVTGMEILMQELAPEAQFEIDVYWVQAGGANPIDWIHKVAGRMDVVHFKEMSGRLPDETSRSMTDMVPIGEGNLDWAAIMRACDETGVKFAFIEQDNAVETDPLDCMRRSFDNLSRLGGRFR
ncbi:MAG: sugar phosphate isomerase/epimerase family protein [Christensenellales bacterium]|jgi:sugar phosphate isomerase/epimerase